MQDKERNAIERLAGIEDLVEKKTKIYSRLLTDAALAEDMETIANRHAKRKTTLQSLAVGKTKKAEKRRNEAGEESEEEEE
ncbi:MAG: hypothetical protein J6B56_02075 [Clostridia bacterium]|nr:hypothetical protein [Clostridia bacterium]